MSKLHFPPDFLPTVKWEIMLEACYVSDVNSTLLGKHRWRYFKNLILLEFFFLLRIFLNKLGMFIQLKE